jgi:hypothetical protein
MPKEVECGSGECGSKVRGISGSEAECRSNYFDKGGRKTAAEGGPDQRGADFEQALCGFQTGEECHGKKQTRKAVPKQAWRNESAVEFENNVQAEHDTDLPEWTQKRCFHKASRMTMPEPARVSARSIRIWVAKCMRALLGVWAVCARIAGPRRALSGNS